VHSPSLRWPRSLVPSRTPQTENPADLSLCRGAGACALFASRMSSRGCARCSIADQCHSLAHTRSIRAIASWPRFQVPPVRSDLMAGLRQGTVFYPELRRAAVPNSSQDSGVHTLVAEATPEVREISLSTAYEPSSIPQTLRTTKNPREITQLSRISNRFWPKNRSYSKQTTKPCLTGARTAFSDSGYLRGVRVRGGGRRGMVQRHCRVNES
jgi:hypothetical protein